MKKYFLKLTALVLFIGTLASCTQDKVFYDEAKYPALASFNTTSGGFAVTPKITSHIISVVVSNKSSVDRKIYISIDASNTAPSSRYTIVQSSLVIPAGKYEGDIIVNSTFDQSLIGSPAVTLVLNLDKVGGSDDLTKADGELLETTKKQFSLDIFDTCDLDPTKVGTKYNAAVNAKTSSDTPLKSPTSSFVPVVTIVSKPSAANPKALTTISVNTLWGENYYGSLLGQPNANGTNLEPGTITINDDFTLTITPLNPQSNIKAASGVYDTCSNTYTYTLNIAQIYPVDPHVVHVVMTPNP